jgi:protein O-GlcNAc transferase
MIKSDTCITQLKLAEELIQEQEFNSALNVLEDLEKNIKLNSLASVQHQNLMLNILGHYKKMNDLEMLADYSSELAFLYLGFNKYQEAKNIFEKLLKSSQEKRNLEIIYGLVKCYCELNLELFSLKIFFDIFLDAKTSTLSEKKLEFIYRTIGTFYLKNDQDEEKGAKFYQKAYEINPNCPDLNLFFLALAVKENNNLKDAKKYIHLAIKVKGALKPAALHFALLIALRLEDEILYEDIYKELTSEYPESEWSYFYFSDDLNKLATRFPDNEWSYFYRSVEKQGYGLSHECIELLKKVLSINPKNPIAIDNLITLSQYNPQYGDEEIFNIAETYYRKIKHPFINKNQLKFIFSKHLSDYNSNKILRIGLVSADIRNEHPIFYYLSSFLKYFPKEGFEIYCYANNIPNINSELVKNFTNSVNYVSNLSDQELAEKIFNDRIHILIDLCGHTPNNRLEVLRLKPAPIQMAWLGQVGTTGLQEIDYIVTDQFSTKRTEQSFYAEKLCHLPHAAYPAKDYTNLNINKSLARADGKIVFGSFNSSIKINPTVIQTWGEIFKKVPNSKILISNFVVAKEDYRKYIIKSLEPFGVEESRIEFELQSNKNAYFARFNRIDIALDPFPFNGSTTTHETLLMSVPLISLQGSRWSGRLSSSILNSAGLKELISTNVDEYINKIVSLAHSPEKIIHYKKTIQERYLNSPAVDMESFSLGFADKLQEIWQNYLTDSSHSNKMKELVNSPSSS